MQRSLYQQFMLSRIWLYDVIAFPTG